MPKRRLVTVGPPQHQIQCVAEALRGE